MSALLLLLILVPAPKNAAPQPALPPCCDLTWGGVDWLYHFQPDGVCITRDEKDTWTIEVNESSVTVRLTWRGQWWVTTYDAETGKGWGARVVTDENGERFVAEVEVTVKARKAMPKEAP